MGSRLREKLPDTPGWGCYYYLVVWNGVSLRVSTEHRAGGGLKLSTVTPGWAGVI